MGKEIERKFLVKNRDYVNDSQKHHVVQGYLCLDPVRVARVRLVDGKGKLTLKSLVSETTRLEFEYDIPARDAEQMLQEICLKPLIEKYRYVLKVNESVWEVDEFLGENLGLVVAEIELNNEEDSFEMPDWAGQEVTHDPRYLNVNLVMNPYSKWE